MLDKLIQELHNMELIENMVSAREFKKYEAEAESWNSIFSAWVNSLPKTNGVYLFTHGAEVLYIGSSGRVGKNAEHETWKLPQRLKASRGKDGDQNDVSTVNFIKELLTIGKTSIKRYSNVPPLSLKTLTITVLINKKMIPSAYIEAHLLFRFYASTGHLPKLNLSF
jgi:hypothetical protein